MFGRYRYNERTEEFDHVAVPATNGLGARGCTVFACDSCRARKLKCSGDKSGCDKCIETATDCTFTHASAGRDKKQRQVRLPSAKGDCEFQSRSVGPDSESTSIRAAPTEPRTETREQREPQGSQEPQVQASTHQSEVQPPSVDPRQDSVPSVVAGPASPASPWDWLATTAWESPFAGHFEDAELYGNQLSNETWMDDIGESMSLNGIGVESGLPETTGPAPWPPIMTPDAAHMFPMYPESGHLAFDPTNAAGSLIGNVNNSPGQVSDKCPLRVGRKLVSAGTRVSPSAGVVTVEPTGPCQCLSTMAASLETIGTTSTAACSETDELLLRLGRGITTCEAVLTCWACNAGLDNSMVLAALVRQLGAAAKDICRVVLCQSSEPWRAAGCDGGRTAVSFGRYRITAPGFQRHLAHAAVVLHISRLRGLIQTMQDTMHPNGSAKEQISATAVSVDNMLDMMQQHRGAQPRELMPIVVDF